MAMPRAVLLEFSLQIPRVRLHLPRLQRSQSNRGTGRTSGKKKYLKNYGNNGVLWAALPQGVDKDSNNQCLSALPLKRANRPLPCLHLEDPILLMQFDFLSHL